VQAVTEAVNVIRMIKLFGWERKMQKRIEERRQEELKMLWKLKLLELCNVILRYINVSTLSFHAIDSVQLPHTHQLDDCYLWSLHSHYEGNSNLYALWSVWWHRLTSYHSSIEGLHQYRCVRDRKCTIFSHNTPAEFDCPRLVTPTSAPSSPFWLASTGKVSLERLGTFLQNTELLDAFSSERVDVEPAPNTNGVSEHNIGFKDAAFTWSKDDALDSPSGIVSSRRFKLRINGGLLFKSGCINLIIGPMWDLWLVTTHEFRMRFADIGSVARGKPPCWWLYSVWPVLQSRPLLLLADSIR